MMFISNALNGLSFRYLLFIYGVGCLFLLPFYSYQLNPDGIHYIEIAQNYLGGEWTYAINAYWSPLISWLLVPFLKIGLDPIIAFKCLNSIIGGFVLWELRSLYQSLGIETGLQKLGLVVVLPLLWYFVFILITPDTLVVLILLKYYNLLNKKLNFFQANLIGVLAALGYFAKAYLFFFFLLHFSVWTFLKWIENKRKIYDILKYYTVGMTTFLLFSAIWIAVLSNNHKYEKLTISTSGKYNYAGLKSGEFKPAIIYGGLLTPLEGDNYYMSDLSFAPITPWFPFDSMENLMKQLKLIGKNSLFLSQWLLQVNFMFPILIFLALFLFLSKNKKEWLNHPILSILLFCTIYTSGYLLVFIEGRYVWVLYLFTVVLGIYSIAEIDKIFKFNALQKNVFLAFFLIAAIAYPLTRLISNVNNTKNIYTWSKEIQDLKLIPEKAKIAAWDHENMTLFSYYLNTPFYGSLNKGYTNDKDRIAALQKHRIDYLFVRNLEISPPFLSHYKEIGLVNHLPFSIYHIEH